MLRSNCSAFGPCTANIADWSETSLNPAPRSRCFSNQAEFCSRLAASYTCVLFGIVSPAFGGSELGRKGRLLRGRSCLRAYLQSLNRESEFLSTLGTVSTVALDDLTRRF